MIAHSAERLRLSRLSRRMLLSTRLIGRTCSTPAQSGHPVEMDPQAKVQMRREQVQLGAAQREELQRMQGKSAKDMLNCGWLLRGNGDPKHWTHLVWMITDTSPIAMLAADTLANQGAVRKDLGSLTAKGACTHVCMHPDAKTGRPCGHAWYLKPKADEETQ